MVVPVANKAAKQIGPAQERAVARRGTTDDDVIAAAGAGVAAIEHEFFRAEARLTRFLVQRRGVRNEIVPRVRGVKIDFDHARIGRDGEVVQTRIERRLFALDDDGDAQRRSSALDVPPADRGNPPSARQAA